MVILGGWVFLMSEVPMYGPIRSTDSPSRVVVARRDKLGSHGQVLDLYLRILLYLVIYDSG